MVSRKFGISPEAASQRVLKLYAEGKTVRIAKGNYLAAEVAKGREGAEA
jgi:hypothetical protein